ncbi:carbohydrate-binding module family 1 [Xylariaceae sp. FL0804]|nr:carbohydrate-binding module family 1 [Xylariaceae sp. FL0804]
MAGRTQLLTGMLALAGLARAQQPEWAQCGGSGWTGSTECAAGLVCTVSNEYYSQCLPGTTTGTTTAAVSPTTLSTATATSSATASASATSVSGTKYMFILYESPRKSPSPPPAIGDSYTATNGYSGFDASGTHPSASNPIGNPALPGDTFVGGAGWVADLVTGLNTSLTLAYNFAVGGATVDESIVTGSTQIDFVTQVETWVADLAGMPSWAPWTSADSIAGAFFGINDLLGEYWNGLTPPYATIVDKYMDEFQILYDAGVRNFFVVEVPPLQYIPIIESAGASAQATVAGYVEAYNAQLATGLAGFAAANAGVGVAAVVATAAAFTAAVADPSAYGAADATCAGVTGCLWYDTIHPNPPIEELFAEEIAAALRGTFF